MADTMPENNAESRRERARARATQAAENRQKAIAMRREGYSFQRIADALGITRQSAHSAWKKAMEQSAKTTKDQAELYITEELDRLDEQIVALRPGAKNGSHLASAELRKLYERRAALLGYNPPTKVAPTDPTGAGQYQPRDGITESELDARIAELLAQEAADHENGSLP